MFSENAAFSRNAKFSGKPFPGNKSPGIKPLGINSLRFGNFWEIHSRRVSTPTGSPIFPGIDKSSGLISWDHQPPGFNSQDAGGWETIPGFFKAWRWKQIPAWPKNPPKTGVPLRNLFRVCLTRAALQIFRQRVSTRSPEKPLD